MAANDRQIDLRGETFLMGNEVGAYPSDGEGPVRPVHLSPFAISSLVIRCAGKIVIPHRETGLEANIFEAFTYSYTEHMS